MKTGERQHPTPEQIEAGQWEWQRKFESREFMREANARKARLEAAAPVLLASLKRLVGAVERSGAIAGSLGKDIVAAAHKAIDQAEGGAS